MHTELIGVLFFEIKSSIAELSVFFIFFFYFVFVLRRFCGLLIVAPHLRIKGIPPDVYFFECVFCLFNLP